MADFADCPRTDWNNGRRNCPYKCNVDCRRNVEHQRKVGKKLAKRLDNLTRDDLHWLAGTGPYGQGRCPTSAPPSTSLGHGGKMGSTDLGIVEDGLATAHEFISSVTAWTGHEDDLAEVLGAVDDALSRLESVRTTVELGEWLVDAFRPAPQSAPPAES